MTQPKTTVTTYRKDTAHTFHIIMSFLTMGLWLFIYVPLLITRSVFKKKQVTTSY